VDWYFDTGASTHMTSGSGIISSPRALPPPSFITVDNGARLPVIYTAAASIPTSSSPLQLNNVLVTRSIIKNLVSVKQLTLTTMLQSNLTLLAFLSRIWLPTK
jgi:hypothetical protein